MRAQLTLIYSLACACAGLPLGAHAEGNFSGSWTITGYREPNLGQPFSWCFDFGAGSVLAFPNSGNWNVPSYGAGWSGDWYRNGDELIMAGAAGGAYWFSWVGHLDTPGKISGRFTETFANGSGGSIDASGTFFGTKNTASCPTGTGAVHTGDPTHIAGPPES
jgi:hypothetical protein